jgi:hypothetical protein
VMNSCADRIKLERHVFGLRYSFTTFPETCDDPFSTRETAGGSVAS